MKYDDLEDRNERNDRNDTNNVKHSIESTMLEQIDYENNRDKTNIGFSAEDKDTAFRNRKAYKEVPDHNSATIAADADQAMRRRNI